MMAQVSLSLILILFVITSPVIPTFAN